MKLKNIIKSKNQGIVTWLFVLTGANFYFNWLLFTNPASKNILFKKMWQKFPAYSGKDINGRFVSGFVLGGIHCVAAIFSAIFGNFLSVTNILVNVYPIIVQIYIGCRCYKIIKWRNERDELLYGKWRLNHQNQQ